MEDKYTLEILDKTGYKYYKNGKLHREVGPAVFSIHVKDFNKFLNLDDKDLYKEEERTSPPNSNPIMFGPNEYYYLEDVRYQKQEFYIIVSKINLEKELSQENQNESKRPKIWIMDEYLVYINRESHRFYFKNGKYHRENGPAIFRISGNEEILSKYNEVDLTNNGLYKEVYDLTHLNIVPLAFAKKHTIKSHSRSISTQVLWDDGTIENYNKNIHRFGYDDIWFFLNGVWYSQDKYDTIMESKKLHKELNQELDTIQINKKRLKI